jgi:agmatinase
VHRNGIDAAIDIVQERAGDAPVYLSFDIDGLDLVEVAPAYDHAEITAIAAASIAYDWMAVVAKQRGAVPRPVGRI